MCKLFAFPKFLCSGSTGVLAESGMTIPLPTAGMRGRHRQIKDGRTMRVGRHRTRITDGTMGLRRRIRGDPTTTLRHHRRRTATETAIVTETLTGIVIAITTVTGM